ncbi:MAG TPA: ABC transporter substrate-binding protein [Firmicutes bacterium]|nr:ABC transporter substrate-binding protein [Bacillota bacterium]
MVGLLGVFVMLLVLTNLTGCKNETEENLDVISLGEVTHSAFYAPLYVAIENGYFKEEGIKIDLSLISGANNVTAAVLSGDIDVGFCGPEATIYIYNGGEKDYVRTFAGLTKRDGQFLVGRKEYKNFTWDMLEGKRVLAGRIGGMPELNFENALKNAGVEKSKVDIDTSIDFASLTSAFIGKEGDFVNLFEPNATKLAGMGYGYVVASIGEKSGEMPYTAFNAKKSYIEKNAELLRRFTSSIAKGLKFCKENDAKTIAEIIIGQFPDTSINDLETIVKRYKDADSWLDTPKIEEKLFTNLEDVMIDSKQIDKYVPYDDLVKNLYE